MKVLGLVAFTTVFLLSAAYADGKGKDRHSSLLEPEGRRHWEALQRRKPPGKPPGPALVATDQESNLRQLSGDEESKNIYLAWDKNKKHFHLDSLDKDKEKDKHMNGDQNVDNGEESQQERSKSLRSE